MKASLPYLALPVVIAVNAANLANLIEKSRMIAPDTSWDVLSTATILASTLLAALLATLLEENKRRRAWVRRR
ncbi:MAG: hypothetical protein HY868_22760 [Chloroflexi bacterium]|nr:hypothetical protein [Chloroflexota bacterium]